MKFKQLANRCYKDGDFARAELYYDSLLCLKYSKFQANDFYNAACTASLVGAREKAFRYLTKAARSYQYANLQHLQSDKDLSSLHSDLRWAPLSAMIANNRDRMEQRWDKHLVAILDTVYATDQRDRNNLQAVQNKFGWESKEIDSLWKKIDAQDSVNLVIVKNIINKYGWLGPDKVGRQGSTALFLVIQHADSATQVTYAPLMKKAVKRNQASASQFALLEDRILVSQGKSQVYGSQLRTNEKTGSYEFFPIVDEKNVNKRRASVGLGPLEEYAKGFGVVYPSR